MKPQSLVHSLLSKPVKKITRTKASFNLDRDLLKGLKSLCEEREITQTVLIEALIADLLSGLNRTDTKLTISRS